MGLSLKLLGEFAVRDGSGAALSLPTRKTRALLGYLAVNADRPQPRERLMALLWSDRGERQARQSLNQALLSIRKLSDGDGALLDSDGERVTLRGDAVESDVGQLRSLIEDDPAEAANLYEGPFLDGLSVPDPSFEDWLLAMRSELHALACDALESAARATEDRKKAIDCARRLVALDPLREGAHQRLMQLLHQSGDRAGALRQYQACVEILKRELQVEPDAAMRALFEEIRRDAGSESNTDASPATPQALPLPDIPSIAVLPFVNMSGDPEQEYFVDGMAEDIITSLSKLSQLLVIARNSSFNYKGRSVKVQEIAKELGVRYVIEGSVRKASNSVRITAQLIDCSTGGHLWGERFDRELTDIFAVQDEVTQEIVSAMALKLTADERHRLKAKGPSNPEAYDYVLRGREMHRLHSKEGVAEAKVLFKRAIELDPRFARTFAFLALAHVLEYVNGWYETDDRPLEHAFELAQKAVALDETNPWAHHSLGSVYTWKRQYDQAIAEHERAIALEPNFANGHAFLGRVLLYSGRPEEAIGLINRGMRLDPHYPGGYLHFLAQAYFQMGRYDEAIGPLKRRLVRDPDTDISRILLAASYGHLGQVDEAKVQWAEVFRINPDYSLEHRRQVLPYKDPMEFDRIVEGLRKAGLTE